MNPLYDDVGRPFRWTAAGGIQELPAPGSASTMFAGASAANADGMVIVVTRIWAGHRCGECLPHEEQAAHYANCDGSTMPPVLNVDDFTCFIAAFAAGCP
jgi:hypothetical protein